MSHEYKDFEHVKAPKVKVTCQNFKQGKLLGTSLYTEQGQRLFFKTNN